MHTDRIEPRAILLVALAGDDDDPLCGGGGGGEGYGGDGGMRLSSLAYRRNVDKPVKFINNPYLSFLLVYILCASTRKND